MWATRNYGDIAPRNSPIQPLEDTNTTVSTNPFDEPTDSAAEALEFDVGESAGANLAESAATNPIANLAGFAIGQGIAHVPDIEMNQANAQLSNTYNPDQRVIQERSINSISNTQSAANTGAAIGSVIPVVGSAVGAAIGLGIGESGQTQGSDLSSPEETAQL